MLLLASMCAVVCVVSISIEHNMECREERSLIKELLAREDAAENLQRRTSNQGRQNAAMLGINVPGADIKEPIDQLQSLLAPRGPAVQKQAAGGLDEDSASALTDQCAKLYIFLTSSGYNSFLNNVPDCRLQWGESASNNRDMLLADHVHERVTQLHEILESAGWKSMTNAHDSSQSLRIAGTSHAYRPLYSYYLLTHVSRTPGF